MGFLASWRSVSLPRRVAVVAVFAVLCGVGFLPLFGGPGYEQSLASGLVVPVVAAIVVAIELSGPLPPAPVACVGRGIGTGALLAAVAFTTVLTGLISVAGPIRRVLHVDPANLLREQ